MSELRRTAARLSALLGGTVKAPTVTGHQVTQSDRLMAAAANQPPATTVRLDDGSGHPRFCWGLHGMPPDSDVDWRMTD